MQQYQQQFEEACAKLGRSTQLPDVTGKTEIEAGRTIAGHMLDVIIEAENMEANGGKKWVADLADTKQRKYHPLFWIEKDEAAPRGFRLAFLGSYYDYDCAYLGARHACISNAVGTAMGKKYPDLYKDYRS